MKIKNKILSIMLIVFPLLITIGFSAWIIIYEFTFKPDYNDSTLPLSNYFDVEQTTTYNGSEQVPSPKDGTEIDLTGIAYKYKLETNSNYTVGKPINAGVYDVVISLDGYSDCTVKFTITKKKVKPTSSTISLDYNSSYTSWSTFQTAIYGQVTYVDIDGNSANELSNANCYINGIHNGLYYYGTVDNQASYTLGTSIGTDRIIGSTYQAIITMADSIKDNYEWINNRLIIKYKTAKVGSAYYTIEDAINNTSGTITFEGNLSNTSFVATSFCNLTKSEGNPYSSTTFNLTSRTLIVPYKDSTTDHEISDAGTSSGSVYSALIITKEITINVQSGSTLTAAAFIGFSQPKITISCDRGVIMNYGKIYVKSGGNVNAYGYIKGSGSLILESGGSALDCMIAYDWPGGTAALAIKSKSMPTNAWSIHNISCDTYIYAGAIYNGYLHIIANSSGYETTATIIGSSSSSNYIFKITSGYIKKSTVKADTWNDTHASAVALNTIVGSNQIAGQRDVIELYGECEDGTLSITLTLTMETSTTIPAPIGYMDVYVKNGSKITLSESDYMFLPGSKLVVEEGAKINVENSSVDVSIVKMDDFSAATGYLAFYPNYCIDKVDAVCEINGTLEVTGKIGGFIQTATGGAVLNLSENLTSSCIFLNNSSGDRYIENTCYATGIIDEDVASSFSKGVYISYKDANEVYRWNVSNNVTTFTLYFYDYDSKDTLLKEINVYVLNDSEGKATYTITGEEYEPTKMYYDFSKWLDVSGNDLTTSLTNGSIALTNSDTTKYSLYASWTEHEYSFVYTSSLKISNEEFNDITSEVSFSNLIINFDISDFVDNVLEITTTATYETCKFYGWYVGISSQYINTQINSITVEQLTKFITSYGDTIPLYCYFSSIISYTIVYEDMNDEITDVDVLNGDVIIEEGDKIPFPNINSEDNSIYNEQFTDYDNNLNKEIYFYGWYTDPDRTNAVDPENPVETYAPADGTTITLYGRWESKAKVYFEYKTSVSSTTTITKYIKPGGKIEELSVITESIGSNGRFTDGSKETVGEFYHYYEICSWQDSNGIKTSYTHQIGEEVTFNALYKITYCAYINFTLENVTIKINGGTEYSGSDSYEVIFLEETNQESARTYSETITVNIDIEVTDSSYDQVEGTWNSGSGNSTIKGTGGQDFQMSGNSDLSIKGSSSSCVAKGTLITMYDGTKKKVEDVVAGDLLLVFNHETGEFDVAENLCNHYVELSNQKVINLEFSNGSNIKVIYEHGFFDLDLKKYIQINTSSYLDYIGHTFLVVEMTNGIINTYPTTLEKAYITEEIVEAYSPITQFHLNFVTEDILTMPGIIIGLYDIFEYDDNFKYDENLKQKDIDKYGLLEYDEIKEFISYESYTNYSLKYVKVSIGKGLLTWERLLGYIELFKDYI